MIEETSAAASQDRGLSVGDGIVTGNAAWSFAGETARHFEAHVSKSVPGYAQGHEIVMALSDFFVKSDSVCYEIGCSTGALTRRLAQRHGASVRWVGIDVEPDMIEQANAHLAQTSPRSSNITYCVDNALSFPYEPSDFIVAYYTVQFIAPRVRQELLRRLYESLNWGGALLMFEKVRAPDARFQDIASSVYIDYKLERGYAPDEIIGKSRSLKGVLEPFSTQGNIDMLKRAGFADVMTVFKHVCFEGFFAIK